jgi:hypothetical protein
MILIFIVQQVNFEIPICIYSGTTSRLFTIACELVNDFCIILELIILKYNKIEK